MFIINFFRELVILFLIVTITLMFININNMEQRIAILDSKIKNNTEIFKTVIKNNTNLSRENINLNALNKKLMGSN